MRDTKRFYQLAKIIKSDKNNFHQEICLRLYQNQLSKSSYYSQEAKNKDQRKYNSIGYCNSDYQRKSQQSYL